MIDENSNMAELRAFAKKANIQIPPNLKSKKGIFKFLQEPKKAGPKKDVTGAHATALTKARIAEDKVKKAAKVPLTEKDKVRLAYLEKLARGGKSPGLDEMKELRVLRMRKAITPLSKLEQKELEELEVKLEGADVDASNKSGLPDEERFEELKKRSEL